MPEILRTRDVVVFVKGAAYTVKASGSLLASGWAGGQGLAWDDDPDGEFMVKLADGGRGAGFAVWGSNEDSDLFTGITGSQVAIGYVVIGSGSWIFSTPSYEVYTYASRLAPPLIPISYSPGDSLFWSLRGYWTKEDEWTLSGDPRAPNSDAVGSVVQTPSGVTNSYLTVQTTL